MTPRLIVSDPSVMMGKPVVKGTRITVELILEKLAAKVSRRLLAFAAETIRSDVIYPTDEAAV